MTTRERRPEEREATLTNQAEAESRPDSALRDAGDAFLQAADAAIERALSGAAEAFLAQNRQLGGQ
jgi:hypothetical protein